MQLTVCPTRFNASPHAIDEPMASPSGFVCDNMTTFLGLPLTNVRKFSKFSCDKFIRYLLSFCGKPRREM